MVKGLRHLWKPVSIPGKGAPLRFQALEAPGNRTLHLHTAKTGGIVGAMKKHSQSRSGFTLMELLVVIAIITILTAIVGVNVLHKPGEAKVAATKANLKSLQTALQVYKTDNGFYPTQAQGLQALVSRATTDPVPASFPRDGYLTSLNVPKDEWGREYIYLTPGRSGESYEIISYGSDSEPGGEGDAADLSTSKL